MLHQLGLFGLLCLFPLSNQAETIKTTFLETYSGTVEIMDGSRLNIAGKEVYMHNILSINLDPGLNRFELAAQKENIRIVEAVAPLSVNEHKNLKGKLLGLMYDEKFSELERLYDEFKGIHSPNGSFYSSWFFEAFSDLAEEKHNRLGAFLEKWQTYNPDSIPARVIAIQLGNILTNQYRGTGYSNTVPFNRREKIRNSRKQLAKMYGELEAIGHEEPQAAALKLLNTYTRGDSPQGILDIVRSVAKINSKYWPAYRTAAVFTLRRYGGSRDDMHELLALVDELAPKEFRDEYYYRIALRIFEYGSVEFTYANFDKERIRRGFSDVQKRFLANDSLIGWNMAMAYVYRDGSHYKNLQRQLVRGNTAAFIDSWEEWKNSLKLQGRYSWELHHERKTAYPQALKALIEFDNRALASALSVGDTAVQTDHHANTLLHAAVETRNTDAIKTLAAAGTNLDAKNVHGLNPLHAASRNGSISSVAALLQEGAAVDALGDGQLTAMHYAARMVNPTLMRLLLQFEATDINAQSSDGYTPLTTAIAHGNLTAVEFLLDQPRIDLAKKISSGHTPLELAHWYKETEIVELIKAAKLRKAATALTEQL